MRRKLLKSFFITLFYIFPRVISAQELPYPIIFVHGINSSDKTWEQAIEFYHDNFGWDDPYVEDSPEDHGRGIYHALLNASDYSTHYGMDVRVDFINEHNDLYSDGSVFAINFKNWWDSSTEELEHRNNRSLDQKKNYSESNESAILKQGYALGLMIKQVLETTRAKKVIIIGHSMGGLAAREYLQRLDKNHIPKWWAFPGEPNGHRVAKLVTIGTPHFGSNMSELGYTVPIVNPKSEAARDLTYNYYLSGEPNFDQNPDHGVYLFGGGESIIPVNKWPDERTGFLNADAGCDGTQDTFISGLNSRVNIREDNVDMPLPLGVPYCWITSNHLGSDGDKAVRLSRQYLTSKGDTLLTNKIHSDFIPPENDGETGDYHSILRGLDEPEELELAYELELDTDYQAFVTEQPGATAVLDKDAFFVVLDQPSTIQLTLQNLPTGQNATTTAQILLKDGTVKANKTNTGSENNIILYAESMPADTIYIRTNLAITNEGWKRPYTIKVGKIGVPSSFILQSTLSAIVANNNAETTVTAELIDETGKHTIGANNPVTFTITSGASSAILISQNPVDAINGVATIRIQSTNIPGVVVIEASSPGLAAKQTQINVYGNPTEIRGDITANSSWTLDNSPYILTGDIRVKPGAVLTIDPGVIVRGKSGTGIYIEGGLIANGSASLPILFEGADQQIPGGWCGIRFESSAMDDKCILNHCIIRHGGQGGYSNLVAAIELSGYSDPQITNTRLENNKINGLRLDSGTYSSNINLNVVGLPYCVQGDITMNASAIMDVAPGVVFKMWPKTDFYVYGGISAQGTNLDHITFTSFQDDSYFGDSNYNGSSLPQPGDWGGIGIYGTINDASTTLEYVDIQYAGAAGYGNLNTPIYLELAANPTIHATKISKSVFNGIKLQTGTFSSDIHLNNHHLPIIVSGDITISESAKWTIDPGIVFKMWPNSDFYIQGELDILGNENSPVIFTSYRDDSIMGDTNGDENTNGVTGDYGGISFSGTSSGSNLKNVRMYFAGDGGYGDTGFPLQASPYAVFTMENIDLFKCTTNGVNLIAGNYRSNIHLDLTGIPFTLTDNFTVESSATMSISKGVHFKLWPDADFYIYGQLNAVGMRQDSIIFTSYRDDNVDGDTNNDEVSRGVHGDWGGIYFNGQTASASILSHCTLRYGGIGGYGDNAYPLYLDAGAAPRISNCSIEYSRNSGVFCTNGASPDLGGGQHQSPGGNQFIGFLNDQSRYAIFNDGTANVYAKLNFWETTDPALIATNIFDKMDDNRKGLVYYDPIQESPHDPLVGIPEILSPNAGHELLADGLLIWTSAAINQNEDDITYTIQVDENNTFDSPLAASNKTANTDQNKLSKNTPTSFHSANAVAISLQELSFFNQLQDNTTYFWRVQAIDKLGNKSDFSSVSHFFFNKYNNPPQAVVSGFSPREGTEIRLSKPELSWHPAIDPDQSDASSTLKYNLQLNTSSDFSGTIQHQYQTQIGLATHEVPDPLDENAHYFWRVLTLDDEGLPSAWSAVNDFWINAVDEPPAEFNLLSPGDGDQLTGDSYNFTWEKAVDPDPNDQIAYHFEAAADIDFSNIYLKHPGVTEPAVTVRREELQTGTIFWRVIAVDSDTLQRSSPVRTVTLATTGVTIINASGIPDHFELLQNYPNPFNPATKITYLLPKTGEIRLIVYNTLGQRIASLVDSEKSAGIHQTQWHSLNSQGEKVPSGIYFIAMQAGEFRQVIKVLLAQ